MSRFSKISLSREGGALAKYLEELAEHHPLSREEEIELSERIRKGDRVDVTGDVDIYAKSDDATVRAAAAIIAGLGRRRIPEDVGDR